MNVLRITTRPFRTLRLFIALALLIDLNACPKGAAAQSTPAASASAAPLAPSSSAAAPITGSGGTLSIESVMLEYQASVQGAQRIANAIGAAIEPSPRSTTSPQGTTSPQHFSSPSARPRVFIVTSSDVAALQQVQATLGQARVLATRITTLTGIVGKPPLQCTAYPSPSPSPPPQVHRFTQKVVRPNAASTNPVKAGINDVGYDILGLATNASSIATLLQVAQTAASVNESASSATGALTDQTLVNLVAGQLPNADVYVPGTYSPNLASRPIESTSLLLQLNALETDRTTLFAQAGTALSSPACQDARNVQIVADIKNAVNGTAGLVNAFETSLFTGSPTVPAPSVPASAAPPGAPSSPSPAVSATPAPPTTTAATFQQLLAGDLLLDAMAPASSSPEPRTSPAPAAPPPLFLVSLHALESGGTTLTKNFGFGSRIYYSGGAVATFSVYTGGGVFLCSGVAYAYRGFVAAKDIGPAAMLDDGTKPQYAPNTPWMLPAVRAVDSSCAKRTAPPYP